MMTQGMLDKIVHSVYELSRHSFEGHNRLTPGQRLSHVRQDMIPIGQLSVYQSIPEYQLQFGSTNTMPAKRYIKALNGC